MNNDRLHSIIKLLDDPDDAIFGALEKELLMQGTLAVKPLEEAWAQSNNELVHRRIEYITHRIQLAASIGLFRSWVASGSEDLFEASYIMSHFQYPELDKNQFLDQLRSISADVSSELVAGLTPLEQIRVLNHILFSEYAFERSEYTAASYQSFYMSNVLSQKKGNLFTLCLLYVAVAQSVHIPLLALSLPENLALAYLPDAGSAPINAGGSALFYVNPFSKGAVFGNNEIVDFLQRAHYPVKDEYFAPLSNRAFITLMLETIHLYYQHEKNTAKCLDLDKLIAVLKE